MMFSIEYVLVSDDICGWVWFACGCAHVCIIGQYSGPFLERPPYGYRLMQSFKRSGLSSGGTENSTLSHAREILYH